MMKQTASVFFLWAMLIIFFSSCRNDTTLMKNITGKAGEMVIVISKEAWTSDPGQVLRKVLAQPQLSLPPGRTDI